MGPASAYAAVLRSIDNDIERLLRTSPDMFFFSRTRDGIANGMRLPRRRHGTWRGADCDCGELLRLEMWRRSLESVGHGGVGSPKHRGDQRGKVEVPLVSRPHDAGEHLLGVGPVAGATMRSNWALSKLLMRVSPKSLTAGLMVDQSRRAGR